MEDFSQGSFFWWPLPWLKSPKQRLLMFFKALGFASTKFHPSFDPSLQLGLTRPINLEVFHFPFPDLRKIWTKRKKVKSYQNLDIPWEHNGPLDFPMPPPVKTVLLHKSARVHFWAPGTVHKAHTSNKLSNCEEKTWNKWVNSVYSGKHIVCVP